MLEKIKAQYNSGNALVQAKNYHLSRRETIPPFYHDLYPVGLDYYFELNPYFTFNVYRNDLFNYGDTFFVRDGKATFASFILKNHSLIQKSKTHFLIHPTLASMVPPNCQQNFSCWTMIQPKKKKITEAKRILLFGIATEQYLMSLENVERKIKQIQNLNPEIEVDIYLPPRKEAFDAEAKETVLFARVLEKIKDTLGQRKLNFITSKELIEKTMYNNTYLIDLAYDNFSVSDNSVHYIVASRGGTVEAYQDTPPKDSVFKLSLSLYHEVHITPFPQDTKSIFMDLLFAMKTSSVKLAVNDPSIHALIRN